MIYRAHNTQSESSVATIRKPVSASLAMNELYAAKQRLKKGVERMIVAFEQEHPEVFVSDIDVDRDNDWSLAVGHPIVILTVEVR